MPYTRKQVKYLLSSGSPLSGEEKTKIKGELHENPALGHAKKGDMSRVQMSKGNGKRGKVNW